MKTFSNRNVDHYSKILAKKYGIPRKVAHRVLMGMASSMCSMIARGEDIWIKGFGRIYTEKRGHHEQRKKAYTPRRAKT